MQKKIIYIYIVGILLSLNLNAQINDELEFFSENQEKNLETKISDMEEEYDVSFKIYTTKKENLKLENELNNLEKSVIIILKKTNEDEILLDMKITNDIQVLGYEDTIQNFLNKTAGLIQNQNYIDYIYELMGNVVDVISLSKLEKKSVTRQERQKKTGIVLIIFTICVILGLLFVYISKRQKKLSLSCKKCGIDLDLIDEYDEKNGFARIYNCKICGYTKKIHYRD